MVKSGFEPSWVTLNHVLCFFLTHQLTWGHSSSPFDIPGHLLPGPFCLQDRKNWQTFYQSHWRVSKLEGFITRSISKDFHSWLTMGWQLDNQFQLRSAREQCLPPNLAGTLGQILKPLSTVIALAIRNPLEKKPCTSLKNLGKRNPLREWGAGIFVKQNH